METPNDTPASETPLAPSIPIAAVDAETRAERIYPDDPPNPEQSLQDAPQATSEPKESSQEPAEDAGGFHLAMPDGVELDGALLSSAVPVFKDAGISEEQASKLVPLVTQVQERFQQSQLDAMDVLKSDWVKQAKTDPDMGGKNWGETMRLVGIAFKSGGAAVEDARHLFDESGLGNHPAMIRLFRNVGKEIEQMRRQSGKASRVSSIEAARDAHQKAIYPNDPPKVDWRMGGVPAPRSRSERAYPNDQPKH